jgi:hypothetical protein
MAATDKIQIFGTQSGDRFWTNVFHVNALDIDAAASFANTVIVPALADHMLSQFKIVRSLVSHLADASFVTTPLDVAGVVAGGDFLPLFNTIKVNIAVTGHGRNDFKYLRGALAESQQTDGQLTDAFIALVEATWAGLIADGTAAGVDLVDTAGNLWETATVQPSVQMRQLHRKRRRVVVL